MILSQSASPHNASHTLNILSVSICSILPTLLNPAAIPHFYESRHPLNNSQLNECPNHLFLPRLTTSALDKSKARHWRSSLSLPGCKNLHCVFYSSMILHPHISPSHCTLYRLCKFSAFVDHVSTP